MPVIDRQLLLRDLGTLRLGFSTPGRNGGKAPKRSDKWILTSPDRANLEKAAQSFGGIVVPFPQGETDKWSLTTTKTEIPIDVTLVKPTQWMEHYDGSTCLIRCNNQVICGPRNSLNLGKPCICKARYPDANDRYEAAKQRQACKIATRINVMVPDASDIGVWMLATHSEHAADELILTFEFIQSILKNNGQQRYRCKLAIDQRKNTDKQPYPVPVIRTAETMNEIAALLEGLKNEQKQLTSGQALLSAPDYIDHDDNDTGQDETNDPDDIFRVTE